MAMTGAGLKAARKAAKDGVIATYVALAPLNNAQRLALGEDMMLADSEAIVAYIQANAAVVVTSVTGVTTGGAVSGPGTGSIT